MSSKGLNIGLATASVVVVLALAEGVLRLVDYPSPRPSGWWSKPPVEQLNQVHYRGRRIEYGEGDFVIVLLGDSQVEARITKTLDRVPEKLLEDRLREINPAVKVFTVGAGAYGHDQELLALRFYYEHYRADLVIDWLTPRNDIWNNVFPTAWGEGEGYPKPTFRLSAGRLVGPSEQLREDVNGFKLLALWRRATRYSRDEEWEKYLPAPYTPLPGFKGHYSTTWQKWWDHDKHSTGMRRHNLATEKTPLATGLTPRSPRMQYGLDLTRALLNEIRALVERNNGRFILFQWTQRPPVAGNVDLLNGKYYVYTDKQYRENIDTLTSGFEFYKIPVTVPGWVVGEEYEHLSDAANEQVMNDLAKKIAHLIPHPQSARPAIKAGPSHQGTVSTS